MIQRNFSNFRGEKCLRNRYEMCYVLVIFNNPCRIKSRLNISRVTLLQLYTSAHTQTRTHAQSVRSCILQYFTIMCMYNIVYM
jgi:hypothetical protein